MKSKINDKVLKNALIAEKLYKLNAEEKKQVITELLKTNSQRGLAEEIGIPYSTIHDWKSGRQNNTDKDIHISFNTFYRKIINITPEDVKDWGRLKMIRDKLDELLRHYDYNKYEKATETNIPIPDKL